MSYNYSNIINKIKKDINNKLSNNLDHNGEKFNNLKNKKINGQKILKIYTKYLLPLEHDCSMHHCPYGSKATGVVKFNTNDIFAWSMEFMCPRDGKYNVHIPLLNNLIEIILSDKRNYDIVQLQ